MAPLHSTLATVALVATVGLLLVALVAAAGRGLGRVAVDRAILAVIAAVALAILAGAPLPVTAAPPRDPLHFVYALVALAAAPVARSLAGRSDATRVGRYVAVGAVVGLGAMVRLFMTGR